MTPYKIFIFYTDKDNGWCAMMVDVEGNQIGEVEYSYLKCDAIETSKRYRVPIQVHTKDGKKQAIIEV